MVAVLFALAGKQKDRLAEKIGHDPASEGLHPDALKILEAAAAPDASRPAKRKR